MVVKNKKQIIHKPFKIPIDQPIADFVMGDMLTVIQTVSREVYCLGTNYNGQLGISEKLDFSTISPVKVNIPTEVDFVLSGLNHVIALNTKRNVIYAWGSNKMGQINPYLDQDKIMEP